MFQKVKMKSSFPFLSLYKSMVMQLAEQNMFFIRKHGNKSFKPTHPCHPRCPTTRCGLLYISATKYRRGNHFSEHLHSVCQDLLELPVANYFNSCFHLFLIPSGLVNVKQMPIQVHTQLSSIVPPLTG